MSTVSSLLPLLKRSRGCRFVGTEITSSTSVVLLLFRRPARLSWFSTSLRPSRLKFPLSSCGFPDHRSQCVLTHTHTQTQKTLQSPSAVSSRTPCPSPSILIFIWLPRSSQSSFFSSGARRRHARPLAISLFFALRRVLPQRLRFLGEDSSESLISSECVKGLKRGEEGGDTWLRTQANYLYQHWNSRVLSQIDRGTVGGRSSTLKFPRSRVPSCNYNFRQSFLKRLFPPHTRQFDWSLDQLRWKNLC